MNVNESSVGISGDTDGIECLIGAIKKAELFMLITMITTLLTAITAFYVGRADLVRSTSAFKRLH